MSYDSERSVEDSDSNPDGPTRGLSFHGSGMELFKITIVNLLLTIVTLGIYYFWGRTRVRQYVYAHVEFEDDRFVYHGTGKELLLGWLKAMGFLIVISLIVLALVYPTGLAELMGLGVAALFYVPLILFVPLIIVGSMRYRLSRMSWRSIRFSFQGKVRPFAWLWVKGLLLTMVTLSLYGPYLQMKMRRFLTEHSRFGTRSFGFDGQGGDILKRYILSLVLLFPTLGIYQFWYLAYVHRYSWGRTSVENAQFRSTVTGGGLFKLYLGNVLLVIFTLGLAQPWATIRTLRYQMSNLHIGGALDLETIQQDYQAAKATADEMGDILELDMVDIGFGL